MIGVVLRRILMERNNKRQPICCIFNYAPHYRQSIYKKMESAFDLHYYVGDKTYSDIKKMDYSIFVSQLKEVKNIRLYGYFYWLRGSVSLYFHSYRTYILTGEPYCISSWIILLLSRMSKKKVYLWGQGMNKKDSTKKNWIKSIYYNLSDGNFLYGNRAKQIMDSKGVNSENNHVIYNSLDYDRQRKVRESLDPTETHTVFKRFQNNSYTLIFIGRLTKQKKLHLLIDAVSELNKNEVEYSLLIIGDGEEREKLEKVAESCLDDGCYYFYGKTYDEQEIGELISGSDLCVSPGNVGLTAIHSLSYGTPVCTHSNFDNQMPEFESIVPGETGFFFEENSVEHMVKGIKNWRKNSERNIVRSNCIEIVEKYYNPFFQIDVIRAVLKKAD